MFRWRADDYECEQSFTLIAEAVNTIERKTMKTSSISKVAIALGVNALVLGGLVAGPAQADPTSGVLYGDLVGTGSDTTQDIMNGLSIALGTNPDTGKRYIASYDAAPGTGAGSASGDCNTANDKITPQASGGPTFVRPNGSGNGRDTLRAAIGQAATATVKSFACGLSGGASATLNATDIQGAVHFARSSSGPAAADTSSVGAVAYVPFAKDAVGVAVSSTSKIPALTFGTAAVNTAVGGVTGKVESTLYAIYTCKATQVIVPNTGASFLADDTYTVGLNETAHDLNVYIPQAGSGTRSFWIGKFNVTETNITNAAANAACLDATINGGPHDGEAVQEHSGLAVGSDDYAIVPFSVPQFVAQSNGVPGVASRVNNAVLRPIGGVNPTSGTAPTLSLNPTFTTSSASSMLGRLVYNIVPSRELDDPNSLTHEVFAGKTSRICAASDTIRTYGFAVLTANTGSSSCGYTGLRAYAPSSASVTIDVASAATSGASTVTNAVEGNTVHFRLKNLVSNGNGGGVVQFSDGAGNVFAELDVPAGTPPTTGSTGSWLYESVTLDENLPAGVYDVVATFIPNLAGVAASTTANLITFSLDQREVDSIDVDATTYASTYKVRKKGKLGVTVTTTGLAASGSVTVFQGSKVLGTATLDDEGSAVVTFRKPFTKKGNVSLTVSYSGDDTYIADTTTQAITVRK